MSGSYIILEKIDGVAILRMNRPERYNAFGFKMAEEMERRIEDCFDEGIKVVVITGAGSAFSSGGDMKELKEEYLNRRGEFFRDLTKKLHRIITDIRLLPKPVIAMINGPAGGAGFSIAMACDLRFASDRAKFKQAYTSIGLCPDGGWTVFVPAAVGYAKAMELLLLDPVIDAKEALTLGIVCRVFPHEELEERTLEIARRLARGPLLSFAKAKALVNSSMFDHLEKQLERERQAIFQCGLTEDFEEGLNAFFEKREPVFKGI